jgi:hypothetical protein
MRMPFGKFRGLSISDLPDDYLDWLHDLDDLGGPLRWAVDSEWRYRQSADESRDRMEERAGELDAEDRPLLAELIRAGYRALALKYHQRLGWAAGYHEAAQSFDGGLPGALAA